MANKGGYGQYCPISVAAEVVTQKWTPLVLRGLFCGCKRFNEIAKSVPRMSSALLSRRLKELEYAGIVERVRAEKSAAVEYRLTQAGQELWPVLDRMGAWAQTWLRREITKDENLDPDILMWEIRLLNPMLEETSSKRRVVKFHLQGVPIANRFYWLVHEPEENEVCISDPGYEVDLFVTAHIRTLVEIWMGHKTIAQARRIEELALDGPGREISAFSKWFALSHFAQYGVRSQSDSCAITLSVAHCPSGHDEEP